MNRIIKLLTIVSLFTLAVPTMAQDSLISANDFHVVYLVGMFFAGLVIAAVGGAVSLAAYIRGQHGNIELLERLERAHDKQDQQTREVIAFVAQTMSVVALAMPTQDMKDLLTESGRFIEEISDGIPVGTKVTPSHITSAAVRSVKIEADDVTVNGSPNFEG